MQWAIDAMSINSKKRGVLSTPEGKYRKDETARMSFCTICNCVWEKDRDAPQYLQKYVDFPSIGIKRKDCKYCEED